MGKKVTPPAAPGKNSTTGGLADKVFYWLIDIYVISNNIEKILYHYYF